MKYATQLTAVKFEDLVIEPSRRAEANGGAGGLGGGATPRRPFVGNLFLLSDFVEFDCLRLKDFEEK